MSRLTDWLRVPTVLDVNGGNTKQPYRASCPQGDWQAPRWVSSVRVAREQQTRHWIRDHYHFEPDSWGAGWSDGFYY